MCDDVKGQTATRVGQRKQFNCIFLGYKLNFIQIQSIAVILSNFDLVVLAACPLMGVICRVFLVIGS